MKIDTNLGLMTTGSKQILHVYIKEDTFKYDWKDDEWEKWADLTRSESRATGVLRDNAPTRHSSMNVCLALEWAGRRWMMTV